MDFFDSTIEVFFLEAKELIAKMEEILLKIEQGQRSDDFINSIFRAAHTLKGAAAMFNFCDLSELVNEIENLLSLLREKKLIISEGKTAILLESTDCLVKLLECSIQGEVNNEIKLHKGQLIKKLKDEQNQDLQDEHGVDLKKGNNKDLQDEHGVDLKKGNNKDLQDEYGIDLKSINNTVLKDQQKTDLKSDNNIDLRSEVKTSTKRNFIDQKKSDHEQNINKDLKNNFIKVNFDKIDQIVNLTGELFVIQSYLNNLVKHNKLQNIEFFNAIEKIFKLTEDLRVISLQIRMVSIKETFIKFNRMVRDLALKYNKQIKLVLVGLETELDKFIVEKINEPLLHLVRNACDHGISLPENRISLGKPSYGLITLKATQENNEVIIEVTDDGFGIDLEKVKQKAIETGLIEKKTNLSDEQLIAFIFQPGFSTAEKINDLSGRGVGMDIVKKEVETLHGSVKVITKKNIGTTIKIRLPLTLAILDGLLVKVVDLFFIIPIWNIVECIDITSKDYLSIVKNKFFNFRNKILPGIILSDLLDLPNKPLTDPHTAIIVQHDNQKLAIVVDYLKGEIQTIIKSVPEIFSKVPWISGSAVLGNGKIAIILDLPKLINDIIDQNYFTKVLV